MKLLVATSATQGQRTSDFTWCIEGELVTPVKDICDRDQREGPDGGCGCGRSFAGLNSHKSTTTAVVADLDLSEEDLALAVRAFRESAGWVRLYTPDEFPVVVDVEAQTLMRLGSLYPVGTIVERRMGIVDERTVAA